MGMASYGKLKYTLLLFCCHLCFGNNRRRYDDEVNTASRRFIFDSNHKFTGWASWQQYAACSTQCVSGYEKQTKECCDTGDNRLCYNIPWDLLKSHIGTCPNDGQWEAWGTWSTCSVTCGRGDEQRTRACVFDANRPRGKDCPAGGGKETQPCTRRECPVNGVWLTWSPWTACTVTCGGAVKRRHRDCHFPAHVPQGDYCIGTAVQQQTCNSILCPVDGIWSEWSEWASCSATCNLGHRSRTRNCTYDAVAPHGNTCQGKNSQTVFCRDILCAVDGIWSQWTSWGACSVTCSDGGTSSRQRLCVFPVPGAPHGRNCTGDSVENRTCGDRNNAKCAVDGIWSEWLAWSSCSKTCDLGRQSRTRNCTYDAVAPHGHACPGKSSESKFCRETLCTVDGVWSAWTAWGACSVTCGNGTNIRHRYCALPVPGAPHGKNCTGDSVQHRACVDRDNTHCAGLVL